MAGFCVYENEPYSIEEGNSFTILSEESFFSHEVSEIEEKCLTP